MRVMETNITFRSLFGMIMMICVVAFTGNVFCQEVKLSVMDSDPPGVTKVVIPASTPANMPAKKTPASSQQSCGCGQEHVSPINIPGPAVYQTAVPCDTCSRSSFCECQSADCEFTCDGNCFGEKKHISLRENMANTANFNCRTNGSYKYPVPKQYTYFWPGIYSQKRMTDYVSPYQGLELASPKKVFNEK